MQEEKVARPSKTYYGPILQWLFWTFANAAMSTILAATVPFFYNQIIEKFAIPFEQLPSNFWINATLFITFFSSMSMIELLIFVRKEIDQTSDAVTAVAAEGVVAGLLKAQLESALAKIALVGPMAPIESVEARELINEIRLTNNVLPAAHVDLGLFLFASMIREVRNKLRQAFGSDGAVVVIDRKIEISKFLNQRSRQFLCIERGVPPDYKECWTNGWIRWIAQLPEFDNEERSYYFFSSAENLRERSDGARLVADFLESTGISVYWCNIEDVRYGLLVDEIKYDAIEVYGDIAVCLTIINANSAESPDAVVANWRGGKAMRLQLASLQSNADMQSLVASLRTHRIPMKSALETLTAPALSKEKA